MRKFSLTIATTVLLMIFAPRSSYASILTIDKSGSVIINVLSSQDSATLEAPKAESLKVTEIPSEVRYDNAKVSLNKDKGKIYLNVLSPTGGKNFDVTDYNDQILTIEERPAVEKFSISLSNGQFQISQGVIRAETYYQIEVDPKNAKIALETPTGYKFLNILPRQALDSLIRAKVATKFESGDNISIFENSEGTLYYDIAARKVIPLLNIYDYDFPVKAKISATTGEVISVDDPMWWKFLNFLFV